MVQEVSILTRAMEHELNRNLKVAVVTPII